MRGCCNCCASAPIPAPCRACSLTCAGPSAAYHSGDWRPARTYRQALKEVAGSVHVFVEREFVALLHQSKSWPGHSVRVGQIILSCARIRVELLHADYPQESTWLALEEQYAWLIGGVQEAGWLHHVGPEQRQALTAALAGLYKLAGVDFVREQLAAVLPPSVRGYQLTASQLIVWTERRNGHAVAYDLRSRGDLLRPKAPTHADTAPALDPRKYSSRACRSRGNSGATTGSASNGARATSSCWATGCGCGRCGRSEGSDMSMNEGSER